MLRLHAQLQQSHQVAITAVVGMGGIGKTELALQYARAYEPSYPGGICWIQTRDQDTATQILTFAQTYLNLHPSDDLPLDARIAYCWNHWPPFIPAPTDPPIPHPPLSPALLVIDDVPDYDTIAPFLPTTPRFTLLLTTRQQHLAANVNPLPIELLNEGAALELLKQIAGASRIEANLEQAKALCHWLGYLPLALELAGRYLARKSDLSLFELQTRLETQDLAARALAKAEPGMTNARGVVSAFELSWQDLSEEAQELAILLSCFALAPIPWLRVEACLLDANTEDLEDLRDYELCRFSLLKRVDEGSYQFHQLIQRFVRTKLPQDSPLISAYCRAMVAAAKELDQTPTQAQIFVWSGLVPHVAEAATQWDSQIADEDLVWPFAGLARFYEGQGLYARAEPWQKNCLKVIRDRLGNDHPDVAGSLNNLAELYRSQGRYSEAEPLYLQALELCRQVLSNDHPNVAGSLNNLALLYDSQGRYSEAEPLYLQALELWRQVLGEEHPDVATCLDNLAGLYDSQGRYSEAEPLLKEALTMRKQLLGEAHPTVATSLNNLAEFYSSQGRYGEAEPLLKEALTMLKQLLGEAHPDVATSLNNLAGLYRSQERYGEAEPLYREALVMRKQLLGEAHPDVATSLSSLAMLYRFQGRYSEAEPLYLQSLALRRQVLGNDHPDVASNLNNLAVLYRLQGRYSEAEPLYLQSLALRRQVLGEEHPDVASSLNNLATLYSSQGRYSEAEGHCIEALSILYQQLGEGHPDTQAFLKNFFGCLQQAFNNGQEDRLSNHPTTQALLAFLKSQPPND